MWAKNRKERPRYGRDRVSDYRWRPKSDATPYNDQALAKAWVTWYYLERYPVLLMRSGILILVGILVVSIIIVR